MGFFFFSHFDIAVGKKCVCVCVCVWCECACMSVVGICVRVCV